MLSSTAEALPIVNSTGAFVVALRLPLSRLTFHHASVSATMKFESATVGSRSKRPGHPILPAIFRSPAGKTSREPLARPESTQPRSEVNNALLREHEVLRGY